MGSVPELSTFVSVGVAKWIYHWSSDYLDLRTSHTRIGFIAGKVGVNQRRSRIAGLQI